MSNPAKSKKKVTDLNANMGQNAIIADELPSQPRKASWKRWTLALACVLAIALTVLLLTPPASRPVSVRFVGSTNDNGAKKLIFKGTNALSARIMFVAYFVPTAETNTQTSGGFFSSQFLDHYRAFPRHAFTFSVTAPPTDTGWSMVWMFWEPDRVQTRWEKVRVRCCVFFEVHHMHALGRLFADRTRYHIFPATELHD